MPGVDIDMEIKTDIIKKETIKDYLIICFKEIIKFAIVGLISYLSIGSVSIYVLLEIFRVDVETTVRITAIIVAITIVIIDDKKLHSRDKIYNANFKIMKIIFHMP